MKNNMVQELLKIALLNNPKAATDAARNSTLNAPVQSERNKQISKKDIALALIKSLYSNNAQNQNSSNIKKTNDTKVQTIAENAPNSSNLAEVFELFAKENPNYFKERPTLQNYLTQNIQTMDIEDLKKITQIANELEEAAIKRFCAQNPNYEEFLAKENEKTLNKLQSLNGSELEGNLKTKKTFSEEEIKKMTSDEFLKHKDEIDAQINELLGR